MPTIYYVDGYHGGVRGHMALGSWRDILNRMRELPNWKISLDIEPESFQYVRRRDPEAFWEISRYLDDQTPGARMEIVGATYAQPFAWLFGGESLVRQLAFGLKVLREAFPKVKVETYSVQEPCFTSAMPQILLSFGFVRAVMKNNTGFGGYMGGFDADVVKWVGPDGSAIPAVPHYACEELLDVWTTDSEAANENYARKCVAKGITRPSGMAYQDLGWMAKPQVGSKHIRFTTWREYFETIAPKADRSWEVSQEEIKGNLPWGCATLQKTGREMHSAENSLLRAEKMAAVAAVLLRIPYPDSRLSEAWENTLDSQHHDAWVVAKNGRGRQNWAWQVSAQTWETEQICGEVISASAEALAAGTGSTPHNPLGTRFVRVFNTTGRDRSGVVELNLTGNIGMRAAKIFDEKGQEIPCQLMVRRKFVAHEVVSAMIAKDQVRPPAQGLKPNQQWSSRGLGPGGGVGLEYLPGESMNAGQLLFEAAAPAVGYSTYRIEPVYGTGLQTAPRSAPAAHVSQDSDGFIAIETDLYRVRIDPRRGGVLTSIYSKQMRQEFVNTANARLFNEYRGYFISEKQWFSSADSPVEVQFVEEGPMRVRLALSGKVGPHPYRSTVTLAVGDPRIEFNVRFQFRPNTWIGDPWRIPPQRSRSERRRSYHDDRWKLNAFFPVALPNQVIYKDAAYDVCRSKLADTFYQRWDEVKHNVILNWIDILDEDRKQGVALFSDQVTSYVHGKDHPLALVLAWGWDGPPFFGDCPLEGEHEANYAIMPHAGRWDEAGLWQACRERGEPLLPQLMTGKPAPQKMRYSLVNVSGEGCDVPTVTVEGNHLMVRLFNAGALDNARRMVSIPMKPVGAELVELDGRTIKPLEVRVTGDGRHGVELVMPRFGVRTVRFALARG